MELVAKDLQTRQEKEFFLAEPGDSVILNKSTYKIKRIVDGGMATVVLLRLKERDALSGLPPRIALKCPPKRSIASNEDSLCFEKELKNWCGLQHKNIAECIGICFAETKKGYKYPVAIMEEYQGTLARFLRTKAKISYLNNPQEVSPIFLELLEALNYAYQQKAMVHLDIKPSNILFTKYRSSFKSEKNSLFKLAKKIQFDFAVSDWGIAHALINTLNIEKTKSRSQTVITLSQVGTPLYMAPERYLPGYKPIIESDIFSLGLVFYEILTGKHLLEPFQEKYEFFKKGSLKIEEPIEKILTGSFFEKIVTESRSKKHSNIMQKCLKIIQDMVNPDISHRIDNYEFIINEIKNLCGCSKKFYIRKNLPQPKEEKSDPPKNIINITQNDLRKAVQTMTEEQIQKITKAAEETLEHSEKFFRNEALQEDGTITQNSYIKLTIGLTNIIERYILKYRLIKKYQISEQEEEMPESTPILKLSEKITNLINEIGFGSLNKKTIAQSFLIQVLQESMHKTKLESFFAKELTVSNKNIPLGNDEEESENHRSCLEDHEISEIIWQKSMLFYFQKIPRSDLGHIQVRKNEYKTSADITSIIYYILKEEPEYFISLDRDPLINEHSDNQNMQENESRHIVSATQVLYLKGIPIEIYQINCQYNYEYEERHFYSSAHKRKTSHYLELNRYASARYVSIIPPLVSIQNVWNTQERSRMIPYWHYWNTKQGPTEKIAPALLEYQFGRPVPLEISDTKWYENIKEKHLDRRYMILDRFLSSPEE